MTVKEYIYSLLHSRFSIQIQHIHNEMRLRELGLGSFDVFIFVAELEKWLDFSIPDQDLVAFERLADVVRYIEKRQEERGGSLEQRGYSS